MPASRVICSWRSWPLFIILDGTWRKRRKCNKGAWLNTIPQIHLDIHD
ncbi:hypothetical protein O9993_20560 [Vibrio lentus]|nr:hypothetical protein [Vibrio lentus]